MLVKCITKTVGILIKYIIYSKGFLLNCTTKGYNLLYDVMGLGKGLFRLRLLNSLFLMAGLVGFRLIFKNKKTCFPTFLL